MDLSVVHSSTQVAVIDDFLSPAAFERIRRVCLAQEFTRLGGAEEWHRVWHLAAGQSYVSGLAPYWKDLSAGGPTHHARAVPSSPRTYPTGTAWDEWFESLDLVLGDLGNVVTGIGTRGTQISARCTIYPSGSELSFHDDAKFLGSYTFYIHKSWDAEWGGELVIYPRTVSPGPSALERSAFDNALVSQRLQELGIGIAIPPKPNRIVFMRSGILHKIARVDNLSGAQLRMAVNGFIL